MSKIKYASLACGTLAVALTAAHLMQSESSAPKAVQTSVDRIDTAKASVADDAALTPELALDDVTLTSALPSFPSATGEPIAPLPAVASAPDVAEPEPIPTLPQEESVPQLTCEYLLAAEAEERAMVRLELDAKCLGNERFTLHHNGLMFTGVTDENGHSELRVPALSETPVFIVAFLNGEGAVANATVPEFADFDRVVVQWKGKSGLQLHARESGADYGGPGHIWAGADARPDAQGFLHRLGDASAPEPLMADVYSFPTGSVASASVEISVEAEVTSENCNKDIEAQTLEFSNSGEIRSQDLTLAIPECDAVGDFLVLKNLINDLKIAAN
ncbi:hypothetical protein K1T73_01055 [Roseovarius sp. SCSIO 43702]|uniref:hypothetical protein n=1 Tax=Roseovarius sp. SCSIO 43702 TaxID=2823043 RepID=UPI001C731C6B|nr:hypothetical protein [Roseovarius sp. SCSIO 43702]QYX57038.1 hypothetical protein K1T73_01055 [Roseovarius sp. SCSIO 43702]